MDMIASIVQSRSSFLVVRDFKTDSEVVVLGCDVGKFLVGDCVRIKYDGTMTRTVPPQITADLVLEIECPC